MKTIAIIPARGGSKRIPGKNIKLFHGQPIISYPILAAQNSKLFDRILVSTDCERVASVSREYGAEVPFFRSAEASNDSASMAQAIIETLGSLADEGQTFDHVCCLFATGAFLNPKLILEAQAGLSEGNHDSVIVVQRNAHPIMRSLQMNDSGNLSMIWKDHLRTRSQDLSCTFHDAAQMYWAKTTSLVEQGTFYTHNTAAVCIDELAAHDIDTQEDWCIAERLWAFNNNPQTTSKS